MDPISALGAVASVIQLCDFARRICDIVLVHGQEGGSSSTWSVEYPLQEEASKTWSDLAKLAHALDSVETRIFSYKYNESGPRKGRREVVDSSTIHEHAQLLLRHMSMERGSEATRGRPIVFIAHSLGGLIVQQVLKTSKDERNIFLDPYSVYDSTNAIHFYIPPSETTHLRHKISDLIMDRSLDDGPIVLRYPDPDRFPVNTPKWKQQVLHECLLPLAQIPLIVIMGSYKWTSTRESTLRPQLSTSSVLWPLVRYQLCPLSQQNNTSDCTTFKDVFLDPTPPLFVCTSMACAMLYMLYYNYHQHHRYQDQIMWSGLLIGAVVHLYLHKQDALPNLAPFTVPASMLVSLIFSVALHSIWDFYFGRIAIEKAHVLLRAWAKTSQVTESPRSEKATPSTFNLQRVHKI
ncbi:hypothetical protein BKA61DRAFT_654616 [Leptodontidium sp. MPI-SDFR-AT-0119]|nr:hypothetical protein BKA61DRAFT_654616 [Leptodontidium sp. MPI-SDFR-AT-0119]